MPVASRLLVLRSLRRLVPHRLSGLHGLPAGPGRARPRQTDIPGKMLGPLVPGGQWLRSLAGVVVGDPRTWLQVHSRWWQGQACACFRDGWTEGRSTDCSWWLGSASWGLPGDQPQLDDFSILGSIVCNPLQQRGVGGSNKLPELTFPYFFAHHRGQVRA